MISTPFETTPPERYGGTERIVSLLTEGLVKRGHDVTLFATGNSQTQAKLTSFYDIPIHPYMPHAELSHVTKSLVSVREGNYSLIHNHTKFGIALSTLSSVPMLTTLHGQIGRASDTEFVPTIYETFPNAITVAISNRQAQIGCQYGINVKTRIYNAVDVSKYAYSEQPGTYLVFLGLLAPRKGIHHTIKVAQKTGIPLKIAGKVPINPQMKKLYDTEVAPYIDGSFIEYVGELNDSEKSLLLKDALALLCPIEWEEPFGLTMIEAMACGTPVIAFNRGSVPEIVHHGIGGFIVENTEQMSEAIYSVGKLKRANCRQRVLSAFNSDIMITQYERLYEQLLKEF